MRNLIIVIFLLTISCSNEKVLDKDKYAAFLTDIHIANSIMNSHYSVLRNNELSSQYYNNILKKHNLTRKEVLEAMIHYSDNPDLYSAIYKKVNSSLVKLQSKYDTLKTKRIYTNLIKKKSNKYINDQTRKHNVEYEILDSLGSGNYIFTAKIRLHEKDETIDPKIEFVAKYQDKSKDTIHHKLTKGSDYNLYRLSYYSDSTKTLQKIIISVYKNEIEKSVKRFDINDPVLSFKDGVFRNDSISSFR